MSRTWLLRGVAAAVVAVLVGAWAVGLTRLGEGPSPAAKVPSPTAPDSTWAPVIHGAIVVEKAAPRRTREAASSAPSQEPLVEPTPDAADGPTDEPTSAPSPSSGIDPTTTDDPSVRPSDPPSPTHPPSGTPSHPAADCTDLPSVLDCVLEPVTDHP